MVSLSLLSSLLVLIFAKSISGRGIGFISRLGSIDLSTLGHPGVPNTTLHWHEQQIDHFSWRPTPTGEQTFKQRYFVYKRYWQKNGPIFFYCGNEANAELYVNSTGLMWENARELGAALVFAEHRYYGESLPFGEATMNHLSYLTMEQALADYALLIRDLKQAWNSESSAVIAFGGSYGGMLAAWLRMKYPSAVDGSIAASAPILAFHGLDNHFGDGEGFWQVVTRDATAAAGSAPDCASNVRRAWSELFAWGRTTEGRQQLAQIFKLCGDNSLETQDDVMKLALMQLMAWDTMAMGNFPYPSNYLIFQMTEDPSVLLPAFPVRASCELMKGKTLTGKSLLEAMQAATAVYYNASRRLQCFDMPSDPEFDGIWDYQWCTEMLPQETYFARDGKHDMFWPHAQNMTAIQKHCHSSFGVEPRKTWIASEFGGTAGASNIVFSNGLFDPWSSGGVLKNISETAVAVIIPEGAHHLDLMFSNPLDPESVKRAREIEVSHIKEWVSAKVLRTRQRSTLVI